MKKSRLIPILCGSCLVILGGSVAAIAARDSKLSVEQADHAVGRAALPPAAHARHLLSTTPRHLEWVGIPLGNKRILGFIVSPERSDAAPVVTVSVEGQGASDWARAVADQVSAFGFIAVVADPLTGEGPKIGDTDSFSSGEQVQAALNRLGRDEVARRIDAVRQTALQTPGSNGIGATLHLRPTEARIDTAVESGAKKASARFVLTEQGFLDALAFLRAQTNDHPSFSPNTGASHSAADEHAGHVPDLAKPAGGGEIGRPGQPGGDTSYFQKRADLPADFYTAKSTLANSKLRKEFVDIPLGDVKLHTWVEYPEGNQKVGTVILMQHGGGLDDWVRAVADQLAQSGFMVVAADAWSGTGPEGGSFDSFKFWDDAMKAGAKITPDETMRRYKAARDFALKLPRSNGKTASLGFCQGGGNSFRFAGEVPELNGAVVFYGGPPSDAIMEKIQAPVLGFYGENDVRVTAAVEPTMAKMKSLGKSYEPHIYPKTTHSFVFFQEVGGNPAAIRDAWPRAIAFLNKQLASK